MGFRSWRVIPAVAGIVIVLGSCSLSPDGSNRSGNSAESSETRTFKLTSGSQFGDSLLHWRIGPISSGFNVSEDEVTACVGRACKLWENAAGKKLFQYDRERGVPINFVFDERQESENAKLEALKELHSAKRELESSRQADREATNRYEEAKSQLDMQRDAFEARLRDYNSRVESLNAGGGASADLAQAMRAEKENIGVEKARLEGDFKGLDSLRATANGEVVSYNAMVERYNELVQTFNREFGHSKSQIVGQCVRTDTRVDEITVYEFSDLDHLAIVLAHELGHAIGLGHVKGDGSVMSAVENGRKGSSALRLTAADKRELKAALARE